MNWKGQPLVSHEVVVQTNRGGQNEGWEGGGNDQRQTEQEALSDQRERDDLRDRRDGPVNLEPHAFHGKWNYTIRPNHKNIKKVKVVRVTVRPRPFCQASSFPNSGLF